MIMLYWSEETTIWRYNIVRIEVEMTANCKTWLMDVMLYRHEHEQGQSMTATVTWREVAGGRLLDRQKEQNEQSNRCQYDGRARSANSWATTVCLLDCATDITATSRRRAASITFPAWTILSRRCEYESGKEEISQRFGPYVESVALVVCSCTIWKQRPH